ncbi:MAG: hypothetical protein K2K75_00285 [Muribaculaceae bacterium]|nr:hypothetical protein [Muribaculaceae bacterium]
MIENNRAKERRARNVIGFSIKGAKGAEARSLRSALQITCCFPTSLLDAVLSLLPVDSRIIFSAPI